ncbi:CDP-alcohol phosphatidyltransferase-domain-containing protein [Aspergillus crustosus]
MAMRPFVPIVLRASKQYSRPIGRSLVTPGWYASQTQGPSQKLRASLFTLATSSKKRPNAVLTKDTQHLMSNFKIQQRGTAKKSTDSDKSQPTPAVKKSPILSRIPLPTTHENIYTVPNILTFSRLIAAPLVGYFLVYDYHATALALFAYAGITDLVDGYIARRYNLQTVVGTIIDPMADKLLMTISVACLAVNGSIPVWLAVIILGRDVGLAISAVYYRWVSLPPPKTMARYWDFSLPSAEVKPTGISKVNTALQLLLVGSAMALPVLPGTFIEAWNLQETMTAFQYLVALTTVWSGLSYVFSKDAVKILSKDEVQKRIARAAAGKKIP